jgi:hypothetical protein
MSPAVILSGYMAPVENMPLPLRMVSAVDPLTHFIVIVKGIFLKGYGLAEAWPHLWPLLAIATGTWRWPTGCSCRGVTDVTRHPCFLLLAGAHRLRSRPGLPRAANHAAGALPASGSQQPAAIAALVDGV